MTSVSGSRLSSIDRLPAEADDDIVWAHGELKAGKRHKYEILDEFNGRLADKGIGSISRSAWYRHTVAVAEATRRIEQTREIAAAITERLGPGQTDDLTIAVSETIKTLVFEMLQDGGREGFTPKQAKEMAEAIRAAVAAQTVSSDRRRRIEAELDAKVEETLDKVGTVAGLSADRVAQMRRDLLGVRS
ncbi:DUF3486 family protein [Fulvimarina endophytica]|uniref:DUF3486 family protein n=1 Tax=Fulvimarina endophytica TaxID=2293836 RepID=A0A371X325_9HYPH|nr:DUF3486 family protein [Fulvimarina endophytica]RFC63616.1 DUF3486 family protein [Fulvimarina endophytica]